MNKIIYNEKKDIIYLVIYKLGSGTSAKIWYCIEIKDYAKTLKTNNKKFNIDCKALKIFKEERYKEYKREVDLNNIITFEGTKSEYIHYNDGGLKYKDDMIIINEVMSISLYDMCSLLNFDFEDEYKDNIYEQMKKGIEYVHKCGYLHADIKMENFLVCGLNILQKQIIDYVNKYDFSKFLKKKNNNLIQSTNDKLLLLIGDILLKFNLEEIIDDDYESDFEESDEKNMDDSIEENINEENESISSYNTSASSFDSELNEFDIKYDKFHINEINNFILNLDNDEVEEKNIDIDKDIKFYKENLKDIKIKLTDFGLIKKPGGMETIQSRVFRSPRNILGFSCEFSDDIYALEQNKYELFNGKILIDLESDKNFNKYNFNLLTIKKIFKINKHIYNDILHSKRIDSILTQDGSFLFK